MARRGIACAAVRRRHVRVPGTEPCPLGTCPARGAERATSGYARAFLYARDVALKRYLFTPGPTPVPPEVLAAVGAPVVHHRSPDFLPVYERVLARLRDVCRT